MDTVEEKFLFDLNLFDVAQEEEDENAPPVFSENEIEAARKKSFAEGYAQAKKEAQESLAQSVSNTLAQISKDVSVLFAAEEARAKLYEQEALHLTLHLFEKLFPAYRDAHGFDELRESISKILAHHHIARTISLYAAPDLIDGLGTHIETLQTQYPEMNFEVMSDPQLRHNTCRLVWKDGGALYTPTDIAEEILEILQHTLAQDGFTGHDEGTCTSTSDDAVEPPPEDRTEDMSETDNVPEGLNNKPDE